MIELTGLQDIPAAPEVFSTYKRELLQNERLSENDVLLLRWLRNPRYSNSDDLLLDYPTIPGWEPYAKIFSDSYLLWDALVWWGSAVRPGEAYELTPDLPEETRNTDMGNAARLVYWYGDSLLFCHPWGKWLVWDGRRWKADDTAAVARMAKATVRRIYAEAESHSSRKDRKDTATWAMRSEANQRINAMIKLAECEVPILPNQLDADPWLLTVANGTLDLRTGELLGHDPDRLNTKLVEVAYDRGADCPLWLQFLGEIMAGDETMIRFLQRGVGYSLTGDTSERCLFILYGCGANGKTTFLEVIRALLGDYALRTPTETLMMKRSGSIPNDVARLKGARFVSASESEEGRRLAESLIKDITGGDTISARFLRAEWFDFTPECKVWLATNHKPEIRGTDKAIWDRVRLIPFEVVISDVEQDKQLADKLVGELPGILAWAVEGCLAWQRDGLGMADKVKKATAAYRSEQDVLGEFIEDCCIEGGDKEALASDLYAVYKDWGGDLSQRRFGLALRERGYEKGRHPSTRRILWRGIGLSSVTLTETSKPYEPDSTITEPVLEPIGDNKGKGSEGYEGYEDDPAVQTALNLGGEVSNVIPLEDGTTIPF